MWTLATEHPPIGARITALYSDGSGSNLFHVAGEHEYMDEEGELYEMELSENYSQWAPTPDGYLFFFERDDQPADEPEEESASA